MPIRQILCATALVAGMLGFGNQPIHAVSPLADEACTGPANADDAIEDFLDEFPIDTGGFEPRDCDRLCGALNKECGKIAKSHAKCIKSRDSLFFKLGKALCDGDRQCLDDLKAEQASCKSDLASLVDEAFVECESDVLAPCLVDCPEGQIPGI